MADSFAAFASEQPERAALIGSSYRNALMRLKTRGLQFGTIIDVGAAKGEWAKLARKVWPDSGIHMVEAKPLWEQDLKALCEADDKISYTLAGASNNEGSGHFMITEDPFGDAVTWHPSQTTLEILDIPLVRLDALAIRLGLHGPYLIKLDTHGTEVDILEGAEGILSETNALCIETYTMIGQKRFPELSMHLGELGFMPVDIVEPLYRPKDKVLWQIDIVYQRASLIEGREYN